MSLQVEAANLVAGIVLDSAPDCTYVSVWNDADWTVYCSMYGSMYDAHTAILYKILNTS